MRILFSTPAFPPFPGGGERYVRSLALQLASLDHHVTVVTSQARTEQELWRGIEADPVDEPSKQNLSIIRCPVKSFPVGWPGLLAWRKLMVLTSALPGDQSDTLIRMAAYVPRMAALDAMLSRLDDSFDVVHGFNISWESALAAGWRFARRRGIPFVITPFAHFGGGARDRVAMNATMDHQRRVMSDSDALLTLTSVEREKLVQHGISPRHVAVIGGGLDPLPPPIDVDPLFHKHQLTRPFAIFIGRANRDKGTLDAVEAHLKLQAEGLPLTFVHVGQTTPEFDRAYGRLSQREKELIRPLGVLHESQKHALLDAASLLLLPSRTDSFGIVFLEAWAHGIPVIGSKSGGIPGVVDDGRNGILVDYGDVSALAAAIRRLIEDPGLAKSMGASGRRKVRERYTWERVTERVLAAYDHVLNRPSAEVA